MRESARRVASISLALLVLSSAGLSPVGTAAASHNCGSVDLTAGLAITAGGETAEALGLGNNKDFDGDLLPGCDLLHGSTDTGALKDVDKAQARSEIKTAAATAAQHARDELKWWNNGLQGLPMQARNDALAAYGRALDNGTSQAAAQVEANETVDEFYSAQVTNFVADWNKMILSWDDYDKKETNESLAIDYVGRLRPDGETRKSTTIEATESVSLSNGSTADAYRINQYGLVSETGNVTLMVNRTIESPTSWEWRQVLEKMRQQRQQTKAEVKTWIDQTYSKVESGDLTWSQAVGASTVARNFAAEGDFQSWAAVRLANMKGVSMPENMSQVGYWNITHGHHTTKGILASDGNPPSGAFEAGKTYNGSELPGPQYLISDSGVTKLDGQFTIEDITNSDGEKVNKTVIKEVHYETANVSNLKAILERQQKRRAELEAREQKLLNRSQGGSSGLLPESLPFGGAGVAAGVAIFLLLAIVASRNPAGPAAYRK
ncbi:hypothetical protein ACFR9U_04215 [Halorientalis brevis]|uniref:Envelope protein N-terminal domain-containing protein n=1 Tax=Halorientalis brevis TaxID=1126241 RepID=A0ABD6C817_9EURY|nr:hypothetical protein [Halorientalis brevis]